MYGGLTGCRTNYAPSNFALWGSQPDSSRQGAVLTAVLCCVISTGLESVCLTACWLGIFPGYWMHGCSCSCTSKSLHDRWHLSLLLSAPVSGPIPQGCCPYRGLRAHWQARLDYGCGVGAVLCTKVHGAALFELVSLDYGVSGQRPDLHASTVVGSVLMLCADWEQLSPTSWAGV